MRCFIIRKLKYYAFILLFFDVGFANEVPLNLTTYNVNLLPELPVETSLTANLNNPLYRAENIPSYLWDNDVVACQEVVGSYYGQALNKGMEDVGFVHQTPAMFPSYLLAYVTSLLKLKWFEGGVRIYSKYPFTSDPVFSYYDNSYGAESYGNKGIVYVPIDKNGMRFNIIATHTQSIDTGSAYEGQQIDCLRKQIDHLADFEEGLGIPESQPIIYMGDFNCNSGIAHGTLNTDYIDGEDKYPNYNYLLRRLKARATAKYDDLSLAYSYDTDINTMARETDPAAPSETLDHILCSEQHKFPIEGTTSIFKIKHKNASGKSHELSDHFPVRSSLTFSREDSYE